MKNNYIKNIKYTNINFTKEGVWVYPTYMLQRLKENISDFKKEIFVEYHCITEIHRTLENIPENWSAISVINKNSYDYTTYFENKSIVNFVNLLNKRGYLFNKIQDNLAINLSMVNFRSLTCSKLFINDKMYEVSDYFRPIIKNKLALISDD